MRHEQNISVRQTAELFMTPRLQQAIALLQLSTTELKKFIDQQLLENPLLLQEPDDSTYEQCTDEYDSNADGAEAFDAYASFNNGNQIPIWKSKKTLSEYLAEQIHVSFKNKTDQLIAFELMMHLDENGFLDSSWQDTASVLKVSLNHVEAVLSVLQKFDPPGIFSRSLSQALKRQLMEKNVITKNQLDPMLKAFQELQTSTITDVAKRAKININDFQDFLGHLRRLQFRPAQAFVQDESIANIVHDVSARPHIGGAFAVSLNTQNQPRVLVNSQYYHDIKSKVDRAEDLSYLREKFTSANWLVQSLHKRAITLLQVSSEIVHWQHSFFESSSNSLKPMTLKDIAEVAGLHESTVSRITTHKFIQTPRGMFELKALFVTSIGVRRNAQLKSASSNEIQNALKQIITEEPKITPLSDEDLAGILQSKGLNVARRTIAKYRTILGIASSSDRKRHYTMKSILQR
ncbi:MAG: RNA polymerase factor sigma-54 [Candidatus Paracaedibacteraceae bacterium]|nr:RNA polymerase factor sigma-54 [Candidatus Paracaedibacteraceae bacterium]